MHDFSQQLSSIRDEAVAFFAHVREASADYSSSALWENLKPEDRQLSQLTCQKLGPVVAKVSLVFKNSSTLGESAIRTLQQAVRRMDSALRLKEWVGWEASTQYSEDHAIGQTPAGEYENSVSASTAQSIFEEEIDRILGLVSFALPWTEDEPLISAENEPKNGGLVPSRGKRGPPPDFETASKVAQIVARVAPNGDWRSKAKLDDVCDALDEAGIAIPPKWPRERRCDSWFVCVATERSVVVKAIEYRLKQARKRNQSTPETLS